MVFISLCRVMERSEESSNSTQCFCGSSSFVSNVLEQTARRVGSSIFDQGICIVN